MKTRAMVYGLLVSGLSAYVSPAAVTLDFNVDPAYSGSGGRQLVGQDWLQFNFSVSGTGTVALDAETGSTNVHVQTVVNLWDRPNVGTVTDPRMFGESFQLTATATDQGGTDYANLYLQGDDTGVIGIQGHNAGRIDGVGATTGPEFLTWTITSASTDLTLSFSQWAFGNAAGNSAMRVQDLDTTMTYSDIGESGTIELSGMSVSSFVVGDFLAFSEAPGGDNGAGLGGLTFEVAPLPFLFTGIAPAASGLDLSWASRTNKRYNLRGSPDLSADLFTWSLVETNIVATPGTNVTHVAPSAPVLFYAVEEVPDSPSQPMVIVPSGTANDAALIQDALDQMQNGDTLVLNGDFVIRNTIYLPSHFTWILNGSLTLDENIDLDSVGYVDPSRGIDARRPTAITETPGGATNIDMSGGTYYGFDIHDGTRTIRFLNFVAVTDSFLHDFTVSEGSDDGFTLGPLCTRNECRNLIGSGAHGNALTDKGDHNRWYDCIAEDCGSDGWTPKCRASEFYRCIARRNAGPGFGMYVRIDGSGDPVDLGEAIENNKFFACESYENNREGFSFDISSTSGEGGTVRNNYVEGIAYSNRMQGVFFRNKQPNSIIESNEVNIVAWGNLGQRTDGSPSVFAGGLSAEADPGSPVRAIAGSVVCYDNVGWDVNIDDATDCSITAHHPTEEHAPVLNPGDASNAITVTGFACTDELHQWCMQAYCALRSP